MLHSLERLDLPLDNSDFGLRSPLHALTRVD
jgi:hypothetical protein